MKELSVEEKAKRYDEAIEKARIWKDKSGMPKDKQGILDDIFPELRESEDERTRESLLEYLHTLPNHYTHSGVCVLEWIAWIEKQAQKPVWTEEDKNMLKWVIGYLENKMLNTPISEERIACKNAIAWFKKLEGEQKPNPCDGCVNRKGCINCENGELRETEQKPVDEVEPKKLKFKAGDRVIGIVSGMQYYITEVCDDYYNTESGCTIMFCAQENFELYKQKSAEWSEEDEKICLDLLQYFKDGYGLEHTIESIVDWLKDLIERVQSQSHWKPSDEQMMALEESIMFLGTSWISTRQFALESLYQDLKKLKG